MNQLSLFQVNTNTPAPPAQYVKAITDFINTLSKAVLEAKEQLLLEVNKHEPCRYFVYRDNAMVRGEYVTRLLLFIKPARVTEEVPLPNLPWYEFSTDGYILCGQATVQFERKPR